MKDDVLKPFKNDVNRVMMHDCLDCLGFDLCGREEKGL